MTDELVFRVENATAESATPISLAEAGLTERAHLQEWVLAHPNILGEGVLVVTSELGNWKAQAGALADRLDVLGIDRSGRLVVAELKRDRAPDTVEMQAMKYAAMASRFTPDVLASQHAHFSQKQGEPLSDEEAMALLVEHVGTDLDTEILRRPRIVLVASEFPSAVTATVVWLSEMGVDIDLIRVQAYRTRTEVVITVSKIYPIADVEEFTVAPVRANARRAKSDLPDLPWDEESLRRFHEVVTNPTVRAAMSLCSESPGTIVSIRDIEAKAGRTPHQLRADLAGLTMMVKHRFGRSNWPFRLDWAAGDEQIAYYVMDDTTAATWCSVTDERPTEYPVRRPDL